MLESEDHKADKIMIPFLVGMIVFLIITGVLVCIYGGDACV